MTTAPSGPSALGLQPKKSVWPTVIGVIAIVFASLAIFQNGVCAPGGLLVAHFFSGVMGDMAEAQPGSGMQVQVAQFDALGQYLPHTLVISALATIVGIVLLVGGIRLVKRRAKARATIMAWAALKMVLTVPVAYVSYLSSQAQFQAMADAAADQPDAPGQMPAGFFSILESLGGVGAAFTVLWYWALPVFMLIWFVRRPIVEEMREWKASASGFPVQAGGS